MHRGAAQTWTTSGSDLDRHGWGHSGFVPLSGSDPVHLVHVEHKHLSVPDLPGSGGAENCVDSYRHERLGHSDLEPHLLLQLHLDRGAAVGLDPIGLSAVAQDP